MNRQFVPALSKYKNHLENIRESMYLDILDNGYMVFENLISLDLCDILANDTSSLYSQVLSKYSIEKLASIAEIGCVRSPFIYSKAYRDLMLHDLVQKICETFFPCESILHLNRSIVTPSNPIGHKVGPSEIHRDLPYLFCPTLTPLSLSFLFFFSDSESNQLGVFPGTHSGQFYSLDTPMEHLTTSKGSLLVFDSNLLHCSLPTPNQCIYSLFMYTSPLIKPVVSYASIEVLESIRSLDYRVTEILDRIGHRFEAPIDDANFLERKYSRVAKNYNIYQPISNIEK